MRNITMCSWMRLVYPPQTRPPKCHDIITGRENILGKPNCLKRNPGCSVFSYPVFKWGGDFSLKASTANAHAAACQQNRGEHGEPDQRQDGTLAASGGQCQAGPSDSPPQDAVHPNPPRGAGRSLRGRSEFVRCQRQRVRCAPGHGVGPIPEPARICSNAHTMALHLGNLPARVTTSWEFSEAGATLHIAGAVG